MDTTSWQSPAAYLYVLRLDKASLAWEYLRRNAQYRIDWRRRHRTRSDPALRWDLELLENPELDARHARPVWRLGREQRLRLQAALSKDGAERSHRFSLWDLPGPKGMAHVGDHMLLTGFAHGEEHHLALGNDIREGAPFDFVVGPGANMAETMRAIERHRRLAACKKTPISAASRRPGRFALLHERALQAFDGDAAGASQREIARHLFGDECVAQNWNPDSELRAQVRHLLRRARALVGGAYRGFLAKSSIKGR